ncbi:hypothetical protein C7N83_13120 [Neisseria iguanae]|uniref:Uncharacterized protein n=1 Tax=Neisseria iguanae TaxID=90242 RepID=A0A2P7TX22_9NEIS|nr:hypothetical protein C7N83_13120 [Neisseria iguanae]
MSGVENIITLRNKSIARIIVNRVSDGLFAENNGLGRLKISTATLFQTALSRHAAKILAISLNFDYTAKLITFQTKYELY